MKVRINDSRTTDKTECEVFTFSLEERQTNLLYDYKNQIWLVETSVPSHITKLLKLNGADIKIKSVTETGTITSISGKVHKKGISFRNLIELTEEQKEERSKAIKERFNNK